MKKKLNNILITNDDGFDAIGIKLLVEIAEKIGENVYVISPEKNQSAKSKSITIRNNINYKKISNYNWIVDGTPTDCMIFALNHIFKSDKPDLILSGINAGSNIGDEVSYSGTVAAAWEGARASPRPSTCSHCVCASEGASLPSSAGADVAKDAPTSTEMRPCADQTAPTRRWSTTGTGRRRTTVTASARRPAAIWVMRSSAWRPWSTLRRRPITRGSTCTRRTRRG